MLTNFFVLYDTFLDASLFTARAFLTMIRECMAARARLFSASKTTGHIPDFDPYCDFILYMLTSEAYSLTALMSAIHKECCVLIIRIQMEVR